MKNKLYQYTIAQFIDIACGDYSSIGAEPEEAKPIAESLIAQYNEVSDPTSAKARLIEQEKTARNKAKIVLYRILLNLISVYGAYDEVREILGIVHDTDTAKCDNEGMKARIEQMLRSEEFNKERMENERKKEAADKEPAEEEIRASFDEQTARLMTHFRFTINHEKISASVYANLVNTAVRQQRQLQHQLAKK